MRLHLLAVGRMKSSPEAKLVSDYLDRFRSAGRAHGITQVELVEIDDRKHRQSAAQSEAILAAIGPDAHLILLDERGSTMDSPKLARDMLGLAENGVGQLCFAIGGADGHSQALRDRADQLLSFGPMVWPHMLARVMLAEQLYRASQIWSNTPYHRM